MNTKPLPEVIASATPLPYRVQLEETPVLVGGDDAVCRVYKASDNPLAVANAALLAHSANMLPELVEVCEAIETHFATPASARLTNLSDLMEALSATLSRARSVPMP